MKIFVPTLVTTEVFDKLEEDKEYVMLFSVTKEPYALVTKAWIARRINSVEILLAKEYHKPVDIKSTTIVSKNQIDLEDMIKDVEEKGK